MKSLTQFIKEASNEATYNTTVGKFFHALCTHWCEEKPATKLTQKDVDPNEWDADFFALYLYGGAPEDSKLKKEAEEGNDSAKSIYDNFKTFDKCFEWAKANLKKRFVLHEEAVPNNITHHFIWTFEVDGMNFRFETDLGWRESDNW